VSKLSFAAIGHVTNDRLATGVHPGGTASYGSLAAARLGVATRVVTRHGPDFVGLAEMLAAGITVEGGGTGPTTTFETEYDEDGVRRERVLVVAETLTAPVDADAVLAGPIIGEVAPSALAGRLVGASLQGWLRRLGPGGFIERHIPDDLAFLAPCRAVFVSLEDLGAAAGDVIARLTALCPIVAVTDGPNGAVVHDQGTVHTIPAYPTREVEPTGAGDVFAAAYLIALARGESARAAGLYAACAASIAVEGHGPSSLHRLAETAGRRAELERAAAGVSR
jgi:1D-myo-inositol 3-kinase